MTQSAAFVPREKQRQVLTFTGGRMAVLAAPGSGKTATLSELAVQIINTWGLRDDQEVLIVTMTNSGVTNFEDRIRRRLAALKLPPYGFQVRTLHGLGGDILRENPGLAGVEDRFTVLDDATKDDILLDRSRAIVQEWTDPLSAYMAADARPPGATELAEYLAAIGKRFISEAKSLDLEPQALRTHLSGNEGIYPLANVLATLCAQYQSAVQFRGAVDFEDLLSVARRMLRKDSGLLSRLRQRYPVILEDEAQDSSQMQQDLLELLCGPLGNWVRVGDVNQAIHSTFTSARPDLLRAFATQGPGVRSMDLPNSGRSARRIIRLANHLIEWCQTSPDVATLRALGMPAIEPTPPEDPQPNPPDEARNLWIGLEGERDEDEEFNLVVRNAAKWCRENPTLTCVILAFSNAACFSLVNKIRTVDPTIPVVEDLLKASTGTRLFGRALADALRYLANPDTGAALRASFTIWRRTLPTAAEVQSAADHAARLLKRLDEPERALFPRGSNGWNDAAALAEGDPVRDILASFFNTLRTWLAARGLPVDELLTVISPTLAVTADDLGVGQGLAVQLARLQQQNSMLDLIGLARECQELAERLDLSGDVGFSPDSHPGAICISTLHKSKGLEWDRVYLTGVNDSWFPTLQNDFWFDEKRWVRDGLNLEAEARAQLRDLVRVRDGHNPQYRESIASQRAREETVAERLRLLYVGMTRARRQLAITWNTGKGGDTPARLKRRPAAPLADLARRAKELLDEQPAA